MLSVVLFFEVERLYCILWLEIPERIIQLFKMGVQFEIFVAQICFSVLESYRQLQLMLLFRLRKTMLSFVCLGRRNVY